MKYVSVGCVVGIIAGFCIGPGGLYYIYIITYFKKLTVEAMFLLCEMVLFHYI